MNGKSDWDLCEEAVLEGAWARGYREITGEAWEKLTVIGLRYLEGDIGKSAAARKVRREFRRMRQALACAQTQRFALQQVPA